ncbi:MAG: hypothetical protein ACMXYF_02520, partial [Candidatus Woesearchaeota archaeon]
MKKGLLLAFTLLLFSTSVYSLTFHNSDANSGDDFLLPGDVVNISFQVRDNDQITTDPSCFYDSVQFNTTDDRYWGVVTITTDDAVVCDGDYTQTISLQDSLLTYQTEFGLMVSLPNTIFINVTRRNEPRRFDESFDSYVLGTSCSYEQKELLLNNGLGSFNRTFTSDEWFLVNCSFDSGSNTIFNLSFSDVKAYEPQLSLVSSHPFENLTSSSGFKLGSFDFNLDGNDEIIVVGSFGMLIYSGSTVVWNSSEHGLSYADVDFFVTDLNWDGLGDMIVYSSDFVDVLTASNLNGVSWGFERESLMNDSSNIAYAGVFSMNNNFLKDIIVVRGVLDNWEYFLFEDGLKENEINQAIPLGSNERCNFPLVFDYNKNGFEDFFCADVSQNLLRLFTRDNLTYNFSEMNYSVFSLGFQPAQMFFTDITSDGNWEFGILNNANRKYNFYNLNSTNLNLIKHFDPGNVNTNYNALGIDILNENNNQFLKTYRNLTIRPLSIFYKDTIYFNYLIPYLEFHYIDFFKSNSLDLLAVDNIDKNINLIKNNISSYRSIDKNYSVNISIAQGVENVQFSFENITSDWQYNNYFFTVEHQGN